jgi:hypothetical protein
MARDVALRVGAGREDTERVRLRVREGRLGERGGELPATQLGWGVGVLQFEDPVALLVGEKGLERADAHDEPQPSRLVLDSLLHRLGGSVADEGGPSKAVVRTRGGTSRASTFGSRSM